MSPERYDIVETIAHSPRTTVRRARRQSDGRSVILKGSSREYPTSHEIGQLECEYRILRKLELPGTVRAWDLERDGDRPLLVLEDFGGDSLRSAGGAAVTLDVFFDVALSLTRTLGQIHERGVIHKDIKPGNVLINRTTGEVKLIDFNIATELHSEHHEATLPSALEGSLPYMSPEQTGRMNRDVDYRTDYYSLGITLFELLTGTLPYRADDAMGWIHCHLSRPVPDAREANPSVPEPLAQIVRKLMAKDPAHRYQGAHGLLADLERCRRHWSESGHIETFPLGSEDVPERFQLSQRLVGREEELARSQEILAAASRGAGTLLLVSGYSGIGKSSLINELQRSIVSRRGTFISGKLDQVERNVPYGPMTQAVRAFVRQVLAEPEERLAACRRELTAALGSQGRVMTDLIPELEQVMGPQPRVPELNPRQAHERLQRVFRDFIRGIARPDHPLVIFIDDLQWTDASTPDLLVALLGAEPVPHLLIIGSYRDNEVSAGHLLEAALARLQRDRPAAIERIHLQPLTEDGVNRLIADTLRCDPAVSVPLARLIGGKTGGNPFFVNELLRILHRQGALHFSAPDGGWRWDQGRVEEAAVTDNIVELMVRRLEGLPAEAVAYLQQASCLGAEFELDALAQISGQPPAAVAAALVPAVREQILVPLGTGYRLLAADHLPAVGPANAVAIRYRFQHDRVQQAAHSLLGTDERARVHLAIGRSLLRQGSQAVPDERLFELVNHLNLGRTLMTEAADRLEAARLNHAAGLRAKQATAFAVAATYFQHALDLSDQQGTSGLSPAAVFEATYELTLCLFSSGEAERAFARCALLSEAAPDRRSRARVGGLKASILEYQARMPETIATLREALAELGVELPSDPDEIGRRIGEGIGTMQAHLARVPLERIAELPAATDEDRILVSSLLSRLVVAAIQVYPPLFVLTELIMFDLALTHGVTEFSCKNFMDCGIVLGGMLGDHDRAYRLGKAAFALMKRYEPSALAAGVHFVFGGNVSAWRAPMNEAFAELAEAQRIAVQVGDLPHQLFALLFEQALAVTAGRPLEECRAAIGRVTALMEKVGAVGHLAWARSIESAVTRLQAPGPMPSEAAAASPDALTEQLLAMGNGPALFAHGQRQAMICVLLGELDEAARWEALAEQFSPAGAGLQEMAALHLFRAMRWAQRHSAASSAEERERTRASVQADADKLAAWAAGCPENFAHKHLLLMAELARLDGAPAEQVMDLYAQAIRATGTDFAHIRALAHERQATYWQEHGHPRIARALLQEAYFVYEQWGAVRKLRLLEQQVPELVGRGIETRPTEVSSTLTRTGGTGTAAGALMDVASVIKATQAISGEVKPERLYARLMATIIENAGAERGFLILRSESGGLHVEAEVDVRADAAVPGDSTPLEQRDDLSPEIVRYVDRTQQPVIVDDAAADRLHRLGPHAERRGAKSILCVPVLNRGALVGILYAENNATTHAFTPARVGVVQAIASQAAISITNARLYETLEEKVAQRTRALAEKNQEVLAMLSSMKQGVFTLDEDLLIQPGYSPHLALLLGTEHLAGRDALELLFAASNVGPDAVATTRLALAVTIGGPAFLADLNVGNLVRELERQGTSGERQFWELDWTPIVAESESGNDDAVVQRFLVIVRDVTLVRQLRASAAEDARQLDMVGQILNAGLDAFAEFARASEEAGHRALDVLRSKAPLSAPTLDGLFRGMHTIKGEARILGLSHLVDSVHRAESCYQEARGSQAPELLRAQLIEATEGAMRDLQRYQDVVSTKLGELHRGAGARDAIVTPIQALLDRLSAGQLDPAAFADAVRELIVAAQAVRPQDVVHACARGLPSLAAELGKEAPAVVCEAGETLLSVRWGRILKEVLVHAFRNAIDHGIEAPEERSRQGKPTRGRISVSVRPQGPRGGATIRVHDDGQGLRLAALRGLGDDPEATEQDLAQLVFRPGVSTARQVTDLSGRGVGLDAIRAVVRENGGEARIELAAGTDGPSRPFDLVLDLPPSALRGPGSASVRDVSGT